MRGEVVRFETLEESYSPVVDLKVALLQYLEVVLWAVLRQLYPNTYCVYAHVYHNCDT